LAACESANPFAFALPRISDGKAYRAEWPPPARSSATRVAAPKAGDRLVITGNPMRDVAAITARFPTLKLDPPAKPVVDVVQIRGVAHANAQP
jgi:hypothetical protein